MIDDDEARALAAAHAPNVARGTVLTLVAEINARSARGEVGSPQGLLVSWLRKREAVARDSLAASRKAAEAAAQVNAKWRDFVDASKSSPRGIPEDVRRTLDGIERDLANEQRYTRAARDYGISVFRSTRGRCIAWWWTLNGEKIETGWHGHENDAIRQAFDMMVAGATMPSVFSVSRSRGVEIEPLIREWHAAHGNGFTMPRPAAWPVLEPPATVAEATDDA